MNLNEAKRPVLIFGAGIHQSHAEREARELAYQQLIAEGYLVARERSGLFITEGLVELVSGTAPSPPSARFA